MYVSCLNNSLYKDDWFFSHQLPLHGRLRDSACNPLTPMLYIIAVANVCPSSCCRITCDAIKPMTYELEDWSRFFAPRQWFSHLFSHISHTRLSSHCLSRRCSIIPPMNCCFRFIDNAHTLHRTPPSTFIARSISPLPFFMQHCCL